VLVGREQRQLVGRWHARERRAYRRVRQRNAGREGNR
jgi:hypothetical protein